MISVRYIDRCTGMKRQIMQVPMRNRWKQLDDLRQRLEDEGHEIIGQYVHASGEELDVATLQ